jgi:hypothetical protein
VTGDQAPPCDQGGGGSERSSRSRAVGQLACDGRCSERSIPLVSGMRSEEVKSDTSHRYSSRARLVAHQRQSRSSSRPGRRQTQRCPGRSRCDECPKRQASKAAALHRRLERPAMRPAHSEQYCRMVSGKQCRIQRGSVGLRGA